MLFWSLQRGLVPPGEYIVAFAAAMFVVLCHGSSKKVKYPFDEEVGSVMDYLGS